MTTPMSTPVRQAKLGIASTKSMPVANEYKKLFGEQHQRLWLKHQQDLDLIDDIRTYVKARLSMEREYSAALTKLAKQHANRIAKKFTLLNQCDQPASSDFNNNTSNNGASDTNANLSGFKNATGIHTDLNDANNQDSDASDSRLQKHLAQTGPEEPTQPCTLYKVWSEHINRLHNTTKNRAEQFMQLIMVVDKLKDIRSHKASIGKKCLDTHLRRIHEDILVSMVDIDKAKRSYYEDENQAKKARENEEKIKKKRSGLLTKFTDLQAKKEKTSAQREANDIQSTQARNDYIMALAAGNAHLQHYYDHDLNDFIHLTDDGVLDHCKVFMATLSECEINSLKESLKSAQYWSKMINLTGLQSTNSIFLDCERSFCLRTRQSISFEPCNNDPVRSISLEHNADYALQHEIDKWFTWFKKECRNLSQLNHSLETCQRALSEGKKSIEINGQNIEDLDHKIIELKQQIRRSEAAKLKAQARLKVIKDGGMQIEEWSVVESEIRADMARAQEEKEARLDKVGPRQLTGIEKQAQDSMNYRFKNQGDSIKLQIQADSDDSDVEDSIQNLASVSRSASNLPTEKQAESGYSAYVDPSLVWQDDYSSAWGTTNVQAHETSTEPSPVIAMTSASNTNLSSHEHVEEPENRHDLLAASNQRSSQLEQQSRGNPTSMTVQSSSPLSAIMDPIQSSTSPYQGMMGEAYKSDYECDYNRSGQMCSTTSSAEPYKQHLNQQTIGYCKAVYDYEPEKNEFESDGLPHLALSIGEVMRIIDQGEEDGWWLVEKEATGETGHIPSMLVEEIANFTETLENGEVSPVSDLN